MPAWRREWEVSAKTIQRDIDYLRDELGAPIDYDRAKGGYRYTEENYRLPTVPISESDLFAVCTAARVLKQFENTPLHAKLASVFDKIQQSLPQKLKVDPAWMNERILIFPEPATTIKPEVWDTVAAAIRENRRLRISHRSPDAKRWSTRSIEPYYLVSYRGEWYVTSMCRKRGSIRTFALSRVRRAELLSQTFTMPEQYSVDAMFGDRFGIFWKEQMYKVSIRFSPQTAPYIKERQWHPLQRIKSNSDGSIILEFTTNHINEVVHWVLSWGPGARVLEPGVLVERIKQDLGAAVGQYA